MIKLFKYGMAIAAVLYCLTAVLTIHKNAPVDDSEFDIGFLVGSYNGPVYDANYPMSKILTIPGGMVVIKKAKSCQFASEGDVQGSTGPLTIVDTQTGSLLLQIPLNQPIPLHLCINAPFGHSITITGIPLSMIPPRLL